MSSGDITELGKADQISFHFFTKTYGVVYESRAMEVNMRGQGKTNKWFSLKTTESNMSKDTRETYWHISTATPPLPPLEIQVLLLVPDLSHNHILVLSPSHPLNPGFAPSSPTTPSQCILISPTPKYILLESVTARFGKGERSEGIEIAKMYKAGILHFRSLYTALRILPCWKLVKKI
ncbi:autophagy-related protein 13 [Cyathus striatus]|nr:autophagy-related protein 13 [Cyathus striatus]